MKAIAALLVGLVLGLTVGISLPGSATHTSTHVARQIRRLSERVKGLEEKTQLIQGSGNFSFIKDGRVLAPSGCSGQPAEWSGFFGQLEC